MAGSVRSISASESRPVYSGLLMWIKVAKTGHGANVGMGRRLQLDWLEIAGRLLFLGIVPMFEFVVAFIAVISLSIFLVHAIEAYLTH